MTRKNRIFTLAGFSVALGMGIAGFSIYESSKTLSETYELEFSSFIYANKTQPLKNILCERLDCNFSEIKLENFGIIDTEHDGYVTKASLELEGTDLDSRRFTAQLKLGSDNSYDLLKNYQDSDGPDVSFEKALECISLWNFSSFESDEALRFSLGTEIATNPKAGNVVSYLLEDDALQKISGNLTGEYNVVSVNSNSGFISALYFQ